METCLEHTGIGWSAHWLNWNRFSKLSVGFCLRGSTATFFNRLVLVQGSEAQVVQHAERMHTGITAGKQMPDRAHHGLSLSSIITVSLFPKLNTSYSSWLALVLGARTRQWKKASWINTFWIELRVHKLFLVPESDHSRCYSGLARR